MIKWSHVYSCDLFLQITYTYVFGELHVCDLLQYMWVFMIMWPLLGVSCAITWPVLGVSHDLYISPCDLSLVYHVTQQWCHMILTWGQTWRSWCESDCRRLMWALTHQCLYSLRGDGGKCWWVWEGGTYIHVHVQSSTQPCVKGNVALIACHIIWA